MQEILDRLSSDFARLSPQLQRAALAVLNTPNDVAVDSMRTLAAKAEVSPPTMLRLAQRLGFPNYEAFRDVFKRSVVRQGYGVRADDLRRSTDATGIEGLIEATINAGERAINGFLDPIFARDVERVADVILSAKRVYIAASGASFGQAVSFQYVCRMALSNLSLASGLGIRTVDEVAFTDADDVVLAISTSPYANSTVDTADFARNRGARIVAITDSRAAPIARGAEGVIVIDTLGPHYFPSMISLNATLEILSAVITVKRGAAGVQAVSEYEAALQKTNYYWKDPK